MVNHALFKLFSCYNQGTCFQEYANVWNIWKIGMLIVRKRTMNKHEVKQLLKLGSLLITCKSNSWTMTWPWPLPKRLILQFWANVVLQKSRLIVQFHSNLNYKQLEYIYSLTLIPLKDNQSAMRSNGLSTLVNHSFWMCLTGTPDFLPSLHD